eukprot:1277882-Rhodomonas_salina.2
MFLENLKRSGLGGGPGPASEARAGPGSLSRCQCAGGIAWLVLRAGPLAVAKSSSCPDERRRASTREQYYGRCC